MDTTVFTADTWRWQSWFWSDLLDVSAVDASLTAWVCRLCSSRLFPFKIWISKIFHSTFPVQDVSWDPVARDYNSFDSHHIQTQWVESASVWSCPGKRKGATWGLSGVIWTNNTKTMLICMKIRKMLTNFVRILPGLGKGTVWWTCSVMNGNEWLSL